MIKIEEWQSMNPKPMSKTELLRQINALKNQLRLLRAPDDLGGNFNDTTGVFTADTTGRYIISFTAIDINGPDDVLSKVDFLESELIALQQELAETP